MIRPLLLAEIVETRGLGAPPGESKMGEAFLEEAVLELEMGGEALFR